MFVLSNFISSLPFLVLLSMSSGTIIYYTVKFHPGFSQYTYFCINIFCCVSIVETCMMVVALVVPNILMGIGVGTSVIVSTILNSSLAFENKVIYYNSIIFLWELELELLLLSPIWH